MDPVPEQEQVLVALSPGQRAGYSGGTLNYGVFIFRSPEEESHYAFFGTLSPFTSGTSVKMNLSDLVGYNYRFLFIALPEDISYSTVVTELSAGGNSVPVTGSSSNFTWDALRINRPGTALSADFYYGVTEMEGAEIIESELVEGNLVRMVGQMVFDIFKANGTVADPVGIPESAGVTSVMDRAFRVEVEYTGLTPRLLFDADHTLVPDLAAGTYSATEEIIPLYDLADGKVTPSPQSSGDALEVYLPADAAPALYPGAVRVRGAYLFPAASGITATLTVHYFDTTPVCGNTSDTHTHDLHGCYPVKNIELVLPKTGSLSVRPDYFTANKIGIPCNRVIDIPLDYGISVDTTWEN